MLRKFGGFVGLKGFIFDIRGKVGVAGNAKRRHFVLKWGRYSFTEKNLRFTYKHGLIRTFTGVLGVTIIMTF